MELVGFFYDFVKIKVCCNGFGNGRMGMIVNYFIGMYSCIGF